MGAYLNKVVCLLTVVFASTIGAFSQKITFYETIAPIIYNKCAMCHHVGGAGPFPLTSYAEIARKAKMIEHVTSTRYMPPWHPDTSYSKLADVQALSNEEIKLISKWVKKGLPIGDSTKSPKLPDFRANENLGKPDLVLRMPKPILLKGDNQETFFYYKLPFEIPKDTIVCYCEFIVDKKQRVHHMDAFIYNFKDNSDPFKPPYYATTDSIQNNIALIKYFNLFNKDSSSTVSPKASVCNYFPGAIAPTYPIGISRAFKVTKKNVLFINNIHYGGSTLEEFDNSYFNLYYCKNRVDRNIKAISIGSPTQEIKPPLRIAPNQIATFSTSIKLHKEISLISIQAHMHTVGISFKAYAITSSGTTIPLLKIDNWDFNWQRQYKFKKIQVIPKGSTIYAEGTYDNTMNNPHIPFVPPQTIFESIRTKDEMLQLWLNFVEYKKGDENVLLENK